MKKIIHISDLHTGYENCTEKFDKLANMILLNCIPAEEYVIVITGDLVDDATETDYSEVITILTKLKEAGFEILIVPGNHDYGTGAIANKKYVEKFKKAFFYTTRKEFYPYFKLVSKTPNQIIAFIGLDSMAGELKFFSGKFWAEGELGDEQLERLEILLNKPEIKACSKRVVFLHHHPFDTALELPFLYLKDSDKLQKIIAGKVDALLFGHKHSGKEHNGKWNIPRCYDAGSSTGKKGEISPVRIIDLSTDVSNDKIVNFLKFVN